MDKKIKLLFLVFISFAQASYAQAYLASLQTQAEKMAACFKNGDYACLLSYTHPRAVKGRGGQKKALESLTKQMDSMKADGVEFTEVEVGKPIQHLVSNNTIQCIIPQLTQVKYRGQLAKSKSYLFGISYDKGKNWHFVDVGRQSEATMRKFFPEMSKRIVLLKEERVYN